MSDIFHFEGFSYVAGGLTVEVKFDRFERQFEEAQEWLGNTVLEDCKPYMPLRTGNLIQHSHVEDHGRRVVFPGPYARYLYGGVVMVDRDTGRGPMKIPDGPGGGYVLRFKKGAKLIPTNRPLSFTKTFNPQATDHWFDAAKAANIDYWLSEVKRRAGGG